MLDQAIWYVESNTEPNALARFDLGAETFQTWRIPAGGGVVRNMVVTTDGKLALAESGVNRIALASIDRDGGSTLTARPLAMSRRTGRARR